MPDAGVPLTGYAGVRGSGRELINARGGSRCDAGVLVTAGSWSVYDDGAPEATGGAEYGRT
jgi:hypothetical protein